MFYYHIKEGPPFVREEPTAKLPGYSLELRFSILIFVSCMCTCVYYRVRDSLMHKTLSWLLPHLQEEGIPTTTVTYLGERPMAGFIPNSLTLGLQISSYASPQDHD